MKIPGYIKNHGDSTVICWLKLIFEFGFPGGLDGKVSACNAGDLGSIPGLERSPGEGNGNPLQCSCLKIPWTEEPAGYSPQGCKKQTQMRD